MSNSEKIGNTHLFSKTRGGAALDKYEIKGIKQGRKELKKQMKKAKIYTKGNFEVAASSAGLYCDGASKLGWLWVVLSGWKLPLAILGSAAVLTGTYGLSYVNEFAENLLEEIEVIREVEVFKEVFKEVEVEVEVPVEVEVEVEVPVEVEIPVEKESVATVTETVYEAGNSINLVEEMGDAGIIISPSLDFSDDGLTSLLFAPVYNVPCISMADIPEDVDSSAVEGAEQHMDYPFFAYTFYLKNNGTATASYKWEVLLTEESNNVADAAWFMVFQNGEMEFFARVNDDGSMACIPDASVTNMGYSSMPLVDVAKNPDEQYEVVGSYGGRTVYRTLPYAFPSDTVLASGSMSAFMPGDVCKYTLVMWIEGDDPDATDDIMSGNLGFEMSFQAVTAVSHGDGTEGQSEEGDNDTAGMGAIVIE